MGPRLLLPALLAMAALTFPAGASGAPGWRPPLAVEPGPSPTSLSFPKVAARPGGCATVAFERGGTAYASTRPPGGSFAPIQTLGPIAPGKNPDLSVGGGIAAVAWDGGSSVRVAAAGGCSAFPAPGTVPGSDATAEDPAVAVDGSGRTIIAIQAGGSGSRKIHVSEVPPGGSPSTAVPLAPPAGTEGFRARAAANGGSAGVAFEVVSGGLQIYGSRRTAPGVWTTPVQLNAAGKPASSLGENQPQVAVGADGSLHAVWIDGGGKEVILATLEPDGDVSRTSLIIAGGTVREPAIATDADGRLAVIWAEQIAGGQARIYGKHREPGGSLSSLADVSPATSEFRGVTEVAIDADGRTIATWRELASGLANGETAAATRIPGTNFYSGYQTISDESLFTSPSAISTDEEGNTLVALHVTTSPRQAQVAAFDAAGPLLSGLSVPGGQVGASLPFSLSALDAWSAPTTTHWEFGDGSSADGDSVTHAYATAGSFGVTATAADSLGNTAQAGGTATIAPVPTIPPGDQRPPGPGVPDTPPGISKLKVRPAKFRADSRARVSFKLTESAQLRVTLKPRGGSFKRTVKAGRVSIAVPRRLLRPLAPGKYRLRLLATDAAGNRSTATARFRVLPDRPL
jgi:hypothetical protein